MQKILQKAGLCSIDLNIFTEFNFMRTPRLKVEHIGYHHCISRIVGRQRLLGADEKDHFVRLLHALEEFHGIRALTYCVMSNHFHLLLEVPESAVGLMLDRETILARLENLHGSAFAEDVRQELDRAAASSDPSWEEEILNRYRLRIGDLSCFMKELKQRFSAWFNRRHKRVGTLWEERYKNLLVEGNEKALMTVAAYIDLNPIRAGIVTRVEDYRWCGYSRAVAGERAARTGLSTILNNSPRISGSDFEKSWDETGSTYRLWLYYEGALSDTAESDRQSRPGGFTRSEVEAELRRKGRVPLELLLRLRVRYLTEGVVFGSAAFVNGVIDRHANHYASCRSNPGSMEGSDWGDLRTLRRPRRQALE